MELLDWRRNECPHNEDYICPECGECLPCKHKRQEADVIWWVCPDKTMVRIGSDFKVFERVRPKLFRKRKR
jgi:hypothetical protein